MKDITITTFPDEMSYHQIWQLSIPNFYLMKIRSHLVMKLKLSWWLFNFIWRKKSEHKTN